MKKNQSLQYVLKVTCLCLVLGAVIEEVPAQNFGNQQNSEYLPTSRMMGHRQKSFRNSTKTSLPVKQVPQSSIPPATVNNASSNQRLPDGSLRLDYSKAKFIKKIELPALETGALTQLNVFQGDSVNANFLLAMVDYQRSQTELAIANAQLKAYETKIDNNIAVEYAEAAHKTAQSVYLRNRSLFHNRAVSKEELEKSQLEMKQAALQIQKAKHDRTVELAQTNEIKLKVRQANEILNRHKVIAPWAGIIGKIHKHQGEWVNAGDTVLELFQMDKLWVESKVDSSEANPYELQNRPVTVYIKQAGGKLQEVTGKVGFIDVEMDGTGKFIIRAEVQNKQIQGGWLLMPGSTVSMVVHTKRKAGKQ